MTLVQLDLCKLFPFSIYHSTIFAQNRFGMGRFTYVVNRPLLSQQTRFPGRFYNGEHNDGSS